MFEYNALRIGLGLMQMGIVWILLKRDIGYLMRFGLVMFAGGVMNLAPAYPMDPTWKYLIQVPAYAILFAMMADATLEYFAFLRRRTFVEERSALILWSSIMGIIPVWILWQWPGANWYQTFMLARECALMWLAGAYLAAWLWLRAVRPIHMELQICDHGEFWGFWLVSAAALASTTKGGAIWRFAQWQGGEDTWRMTSDILLATQICICFGFMLNLWKWKPAEDAATAPAALSDPLAHQQFRPGRLQHP
jgi:hypothetical protein